MIVPQEIRQLPLSEKLALLDALWSEISSEPENIDVPQWHKELLDTRYQAYLSGQEEVIDWEMAKSQIRQSINEG